MFTLKSLTIRVKIINIYNNFKTIEKITIIYNTQTKINSLDHVSHDINGQSSNFVQLFFYGIYANISWALVIIFVKFSQNKMKLGN